LAPAGGFRALPKNDMMLWLIGVCGHPLTTRRVCGAVRFAVTAGRFFAAAGSALAFALTEASAFDAACGTGFLPATGFAMGGGAAGDSASAASSAGAACGGVSSFGSARTTSGSG
jgi:hypothetical protein